MGSGNQQARINCGRWQSAIIRCSFDTLEEKRLRRQDPMFSSLDFRRLAVTLIKLQIDTFFFAGMP
jgi:hypothetical protein